MLQTPRVTFIVSMTPRNAALLQLLHNSADAGDSAAVAAAYAALANPELDCPLQEPT